MINNNGDKRLQSACVINVHTLPTYNYITHTKVEHLKHTIVTHCVNTLQNSGTYILSSSGSDVILDMALKYVIPLVGCSANCIGTASVIRYVHNNNVYQVLP